MILKLPILKVEFLFYLKLSISLFFLSLPLLFTAQGNCYFFDGNDDQITINSSVLDNISTCDFTLEAWISPNNLNPNSFYSILSNRASGSNSGVYLVLHPPCCGSSNPMLSLRIGTFNYLIIDNGSYTGNLYDDSCKYIAISREKDILSFYIDGQIIGTRVINPISYPNITTGQDLKIGIDAISPNPFSGGISEVKIWKTARTEDEVLQDMNESIPLNRDNLVGYWRLNDNLGNQIIVDYSDFANDGVLGSDSTIQSNDPQLGAACCNDVSINECYTTIIHDENTQLENETYQASLFIESTAQVQETENVTYTAGDYILLKEGFIAQGSFHANIGLCSDGDDFTINTIAPENNTLVQDETITFQWELENYTSSTYPANINYQIQILEVGAAQNISEIVSNNIVAFSRDFALLKAAFQEIILTELSLTSNETYLWQVSFIDNTGNRVESNWSYFDYFNFPFPIDPDPCDSDCPSLRANSFNAYNVNNYWTDEGNYLSTFETTQAGCDDDGFVKMYSDGVSHSIISQVTLQTLAQDNLYQMGMCIRTNGYAKLKVFAYNGTPTNFEVGPDVALIGVSGEILPTNGSWVQFQFPVWEANKDFNKIAITVEKVSEEFSLADIDIDNVCLAEISTRYETPDYGFTYDSCGTLIYPDWLQDLINQGVAVTETQQEYRRGRVVDLYGHKYDVSVDTWYAPGVPFDH
ncbi:MAG: LamG domain-containing protein, partial [Bacteroidota bacterium]